jgi:xanthosine utilization system XapX-like protein
MSMLGPTPPGKRAEAVGETVASFPTYEGAQKAVSALIAGEVPARDIAIVGQGLRSIERVTGRLGYATAARSGAVNGLLIGLFFSAILVLGSPSVPIQAFVGVLFVGVAVGMLLSIITYSFIRRRRDFASVMQVLADHYEVTVGGDSLAKARQVLGVVGGAPASAPAPVSGALPPVPPVAGGTATPGERLPLPPDAAPPRYGERVEAVAPEEPPRYGQRIEPAVAASPVESGDASPEASDHASDDSSDDPHRDAGPGSDSRNGS